MYGFSPALELHRNEKMHLHPLELPIEKGPLVSVVVAGGGQSDQTFDQRTRIGKTQVRLVTIPAALSLAAVKDWTVSNASL
jgi:hypothetical protein